jgi:hypothetical protein
MGALHSLFDPAVHAFRGTADGHDAMALQVQVMVALRMLSAAEKKVGKEGRRRERKWGAKMVAREEGWKGEISESEYTNLSALMRAFEGPGASLRGKVCSL